MSSVGQAKIVGNDCVEGVEYQAGGTLRFIECDTVLLHFGVIPNTQITRLTDAAHGWNEQEGYWFPIVDRWQETSIENVMVAGDGGVILGDRAAEISGRLSVYRIAHRLGRISDQSLKGMTMPLHRELTRLASGRTFVDAIFRVPQSMLLPSPEAIVCRCEEISVSDIEAAIARGSAGMRQVKVHSRVGMGNCRAQMCSTATTAILQSKVKDSGKVVEPATLRPPIRPLTLGQLARNQSRN
ncbi:(2Fe-2S)-binding protein [Rhizobium mongolense]|uniref:Bacterioferritin-associated ferredoxin n=1 Tax=Rhizobium mongolense TaxID=57676 RepID=A0ABR6IZX7_9HYPH|nr:(2Fe-2S)-binding protein [Rhizobium mongolense]MBB4233323.1 bacterioferritin-associated ferredoxin [Rhizobium mongolense]